MRKNTIRWLYAIVLIVAASPALASFHLWTLNEFYSNATRKLGFTGPGVRVLVEGYSRWSPVTFELPLLRRAWYWTDHASVAYWDALIVAAAETAACKYLLSEDFQAGRKFGDLTVVNPFLASPEDFDFE